ncbi:MAG TPA: hypothetical protein VFA96_02670 [Nocardioides sp.]|nr:hypothetical protein [Nocardioides sp.]
MAPKKQPKTPDGEPLPEGTVWLKCDGQEFHVTIGSEAHLRLNERGATVIAGDEEEVDAAVDAAEALAPVGEQDGETLA